MEKDYKQVFYLVTFTDDNEIYLLPHHDIEDPEMAEVLIPYETDDALYGITCFITNYPNEQPVFAEMLILKDFFEEHGILT